MYKATFFFFPKLYFCSIIFWGSSWDYKSGGNMALFKIFSIENLAKYSCFIFLFLGAGGSVITNFEQLVRGSWRPQADEWLKMSYPAKVTLLGSIIFTFQHTEHLAIAKHNLVFLYTMFLVGIKIVTMITETATVPFAPLEDALRWILFGWQQQFSSHEKKSEIKSSSRGSGSSTSKSIAGTSDKVKKKHTKKTD
ncbi:transmembrane protein 38B [Phyllostomus discolor]|uniref:Transmembrane protein 38B n=1 Tax=Phyllostomus discolor TaxID=89673 RepID=A0A834BGY7_9CHIR|nr:transmembrane protein 38B [Phyllostomus discolor]